jgi:hypothetical protein
LQPYRLQETIMKKLETTRKIIIGTVIRAYRKGFGYSTFEVIENNEYYIAVLAQEDFFGSVREGDQLEAYLWVEDVASYEFNVSIIGKIVSGPPILFLGHTEDISRSPQRKCLTAQVDVPIKFFTFNPGDQSKGITTEEIVLHTGRIVLLADREATIRSDSDIRGNKFLKGTIVIDGETIELVGMLDCINEEKNVYNLLFTGMHDKVRNHILDYIFSIYRE